MAIELGAAYLSILPSTDKIASGIRAELDKVSKEAEASGEESGASFADGFKGKAKAALGVGLGLVIGGGIGAGFSEALDQGQMSAKLTASLGLSEAQSARAGKVAGSLYADNYGESMEEVNEGIRTVMQNVDGMRGASEGTLERISAKVLTTASVFDQDLGGVTRAIGQMMRTGLAKDADEALDVLTVGFQKGADKSEDFLDTLNEYGTQFRKLGLNGKVATGLITQGLQAGARDGDKVADAMKEFAIRAVDGEDASQVAYRQLGLNAKKMTDQIAGGGKGAASGLQTVLDRLREMKDPVKREAAAVGLFGTQAEDLGDALYALDPSSAVKGLGKVGGAAKKATKEMGDTPASKWSSFTRTLQQGFVSVMGGKVIPAIEDAVKWIKENKTVLTAVAAVLATAATAYLSYVGTVKVITAVTKAWRTAQMLLNGAMLLNPIGIVVAVIAALVVAFVIAYKKSETFRNIVKGALDKVKAAGVALGNFFTKTIPAAFAKVKEAGQTAAEWIRDKWTALVGWAKSLPGKITAAAGGMWDKVKARAGEAKEWIVEKFTAVVGFVRSLPGKVTSAASGMWDGIKRAFESAINSIIRMWNNLSFTLPSISIKGKQIFGGATFSTPNIPELAKGGILTEPTLNIAGEAGPEAVIPLDRLAGMLSGAALAGASMTEARRYSNPSPVASSGSRRTEFVITNWRTGEGYFREIAEDTYAGEQEFAGMTRRMT